MSDLPQCYSFKSGQEGPSLLIFGAVHGNEVCGMHAAGAWRQKFETGEAQLLRGKVTFVPMANPQACAQGVRYIDENLNRIFHHHDMPKSYEAHLANALMPLIKEHAYLIDLHSYPTGKDVFGFLDYPGEKETEFAMALGVPCWVSGWPELFYPEEDHTSLAASHHAGQISVTIECGLHDDPKSVDVASSVIEAGLAALGLIEADDIQKCKKYGGQQVHVFERVLKKGEGRFARRWQHMDHVFKNEVIASYQDGTQICAQESCHVFLPHETAKPGDEWFYLARQV